MGLWGSRRHYGSFTFRVFGLTNPFLHGKLQVGATCLSTALHPPLTIPRRRQSRDTRPVALATSFVVCVSLASSSKIPTKPSLVCGGVGPSSSSPSLIGVPPQLSSVLADVLIESDRRYCCYIYIDCHHRERDYRSTTVSVTPEAGGYAWSLTRRYRRTVLGP